MQILAENLWLVVVVPYAMALLVGLFGSHFKPVVPWISMLSPLVIAGAGFTLLAQGEFADTLPWLFSGDTAVTVGFLGDGLTALMLSVVGVVTLMVMLFSVGYMEGESGLPRYFGLLSLFSGSMSLLVIADGLLGLFVGWELVGACSYLLIGFWFTKPSAAAAAMKAFLVTRVGDVGLLFALALLYHEVGSLAYTDVFAALGGLSASVVTTVALLLFVGAAGKSAQFPLHIWLPDAMELGPGP